MDARSPDSEEDAGDGDDAGAFEGAQRCGYSKIRRVVFDRNGVRIVPYRKTSQPDDRGMVTATVTRLEEPSDDPEHYRRVYLESGSDNYSIGVKDASSFGVEIGDTVSLNWSHYEQIPYPARTRLSLEVRGRLAFFHMFSGQELPDGFSSAWGSVQCEGEWNCLYWDSKALRLTGPCGDTVEVGTDGRAELCDYEVMPGNLQYKAPIARDNTCGTHPFEGIELTLAHPVVRDRDEDAGL